MDFAELVPLLQKILVQSLMDSLTRLTSHNICNVKFETRKQRGISAATDSFYVGDLHRVFPLRSSSEK